MHRFFDINSIIKDNLFIALIFLLTLNTIFAQGKINSSVTWIAFNKAWNITTENKQSFLSYNDLQRNQPTAVNLFCRTKLERNDQVEYTLKVTDIMDSVVYGISCRTTNDQYDFLLTGDKKLNTITTVHRTFNVTEILGVASMPMRKSVTVDSLRHKIQFSFSDSKVKITYDTIVVGEMELPYAPLEKMSWGPAALYCNIEIKDPAIIHNGSKRIILSTNPGCIRNISFFSNNSSQSSDRILGL